jgi:hypothetical protein
MLKRLFALFAIICATQAIAANQKPPDVPAYVDPALTSACGLQACYAAGTNLNTLGDNSNAHGGTAPYYANMPADIPTVNRSDFVMTSPTGDFCVFNIATYPACAEAKFRTLAGVNKVAFDDPIRNYGEPGTSHCHEFFGNTGVSSYSTYASLRTRDATTASGGLSGRKNGLNATAYWFPCPIKTNPFGNGKNYAVKGNATLYYLESALDSHAGYLSRLPRAVRFVLAFPMDDPDDSIVLKEIYTANAQTGTAGRYSVRNDGYNAKFVWRCFNPATSGYVSPTAADYYGNSGHDSTLNTKNANGSDPWAGACTDGMALSAEAGAPGCWDGVNPWSPGGYQHMRYAIWDSYESRYVCPLKWYRLPSVLVHIILPHRGPSDYLTWNLSSDAGAQTKLNSLPTCTTGYANAPCAVGGPHTLLPGMSFHTDWFGAWDDTTFMQWQTNCSGVNHASGTCPVDFLGPNLTTGTTEAMHTTQSSYTSYDTSVASDMYLLHTPTHSGMVGMNSH